MRPDASKRFKYSLADSRCEGSKESMCLHAARKAENSILLSFCCSVGVYALRCRYSIKSPKSKARSPFKNVSMITQPAENISIAGVSICAVDLDDDDIFVDDDAADTDAEVSPLSSPLFLLFPGV